MAVAHSPQDFPPETRAVAARAILMQFGKAVDLDLLPSDPSVLRTFMFSRCDNEAEEQKLFGCAWRRRRRAAGGGGEGAGALAWPTRPRSHCSAPILSRMHRRVYQGMMQLRPEHYRPADLLAAMEVGPAAITRYIVQVYSKTWHTPYSQWFVANIQRFQ